MSEVVWDIIERRSPCRGLSIWSHSRENPTVWLTCLLLRRVEQASGSFSPIISYSAPY